MLLVVVGVVGVRPVPAQACSCVELTRVEALAFFDATFVGRVVDVTTVEGFLRPRTHRARVVVEEVYTGEVHEVMHVRSAADGAACGADLVPGRHDLWFASREGDGWRVSGCAPGGPVPEDAALPELGPPEAPLPGESGRLRTPWVVPAAVAVGVLMAGAAALAWWRRRGGTAGLSPR